MSGKQSEQDDSGNLVWKQYHQFTCGSVKPCDKFSSRVKCKRGGAILPNFLFGEIRYACKVPHPRAQRATLCKSGKSTPPGRQITKWHPHRATNQIKTHFLRILHQECVRTHGGWADFSSTHPLVFVLGTDHTPV